MRRAGARSPPARSGRPWPSRGRARTRPRGPAGRRAASGAGRPRQRAGREHRRGGRLAPRAGAMAPAARPSASMRGTTTAASSRKRRTLSRSSSRIVSAIRATLLRSPSDRRPCVRPMVQQPGRSWPKYQAGPRRSSSSSCGRYYRMASRYAQGDYAWEATRCSICPTVATNSGHHGCWSIGSRRRVAASMTAWKNRAARRSKAGGCA